MNDKKRLPKWIIVSQFALFGVFIVFSFIMALFIAIYSPLTAAEAKTIYFSRQYFSITFLLSLFNNEMPLYYLLSHFIFFLPKGLLILRCLSFVCFMASFIYICFLFVFSSSMKRIGENKKYYLILIVMIFLFYLLVLWQISSDSFGKAVPSSFNLLLIVCSLVFFIKTYIFGDSSKRNAFILFTVLSFYSSTAGAIVFVLAIIFLISNRFLPDELSIKREDIPNLKRDLFRIFIFFIPAFFIYVLGLWKQTGDSAPFFAFCDTSLIGYLDPAIDALFELPIIIPVTIVLCAAALSFAFRTKYKKSFIITFPLLMFFAFAAIIGQDVLQRSFEDIDFSNITKNANMNYSLERPEFRKAGFIFLNGCTGNDRYLYLNFLRENKLNGLVFPGKNALGSGLNLGSRFPAFGNNNEKDVFIRQVKELFLQSDGVWIFYYCEGTDKCKPENYVHYLESKNAPESAVRSYDWIDKTTRINDSSGNNEGGYFAKYYRLKPGFSRDGILLDLFVNDYVDKDRAAELIQDETFKPEMLRSYFWNDAQGRAEEAAASLVNVCGEDGACRKTALSKIDLFSKSVAKLSEPLRRFIEEQADKWK